MRTPAVTVALLVILALGFGTAALADDGGSSSGSGKSTTTPSTAKTTPTTDPQGNAYGKDKPHPAGDDATSDGDATTPTAPADAPAPPTATDGTPVDAPELAPAAAPVLGHSAAIKPVSGAVRVKLPGREDYVSLGDAASVPMGATLDASKGQVQLTSAHDAKGTPQSAVFRSGVFTLSGQTTGKRPVTDLVLTGGDFTAQCGKAALSFAKRPPVRQLWGSGHGRFRTRGRYSAATVRGTIWLTRDTCDGTLTVVKRGVVTVYDRMHRKTVRVAAGHRYFVQAPIPTGAATGLLGF